MELTILNKDFVAIGILDSFESLIWTDRYNEYGDFEIYTQMDNKILDYVTHDFYLWNPNSNHLMIIESLDIKTSIEDGTHLTITGRSLESILDRRILWKATTLSGNLQNGIKSLLTSSIINPSITSRKISNFIFETSTDTRVTSLNITEETQYEIGSSIYDVVSSLCKEAKIGFKVTLNDSNQFVFKLYSGEDRTYDQTTNTYVIFAPDFDNLMNSDYIEDKRDYKNVTLIGGEGEGDEQKTATYGTESGLARREYYTNASDLSTKVDDTTISDSEYKKQLEQRGKKELADYDGKAVFDGELIPDSMFVYGEDYTVGDIVQVRNEYGHEFKAYITEFIISVDSDGNRMYPTFEKYEEDTE